MARRPIVSRQQECTRQTNGYRRPHQELVASWRSSNRINNIGVWPRPRIELLITPVSKTAASVDVKVRPEVHWAKRSAQPQLSSTQLNSAQLRSTMTLLAPQRQQRRGGGLHEGGPEDFEESIVRREAYRRVPLVPGPHLLH